jgi:hypothetical protein
MIIRILVWIVGIWFLASIFSKFRAKQLPFIWFTFWSFLWAGLIFVISMPQVADELAPFFGLGTGRGVELLLFLAILIILFLLFRLFLRIMQVESQISKIISHIAIGEARTVKSVKSARTADQLKSKK